MWIRVFFRQPARATSIRARVSETETLDKELVMKKSHLLGLAGSALLATIVGSSALAGVRESRRVFVNITQHRAEGSVGSTRNSSNASEYIQCTMSADAAGNGIACLALDANGVAATCYINNPPQAFFNVLNQLEGDSMLTFFWEYPSQRCTALMVSNGSRWEPKVLAPTSSGSVVF
jgi:hypothetical protein